MSSSSTTLSSYANARHSGAKFSRPSSRASVSGQRRPPAFPYSRVFGAENHEDFVATMWAPGLLDRLQEPITRYHE